MGLYFLAPFVFAGLGLIAIPYIIHQIRKPEPETLAFSSLMFVPKRTHDVIERKRIQHPWLMLLRILAILLLTFAFTRPYWKALAEQTSGEVNKQHLILLDNSYSMEIGDTFERAKQAAMDVLSDIPDDEAVGVLVFNRGATIAAPITKSGHEISRKAIDEVTLSSGHTRYTQALQMAYRHVIGEEAAKLSIYVVSDFYRGGLDEHGSDWKLPDYVTLNMVPVRHQATSNLGVESLGMREYTNGEVRVLAKVHNWGDDLVNELPVSLELNGQVVAQNTLTLQPNMARQTSFRFTPTTDESFVGRVWISDEAIQLDNERLFAFNVPQKRTLVLIRPDNSDERWPASRFFNEAISSIPKARWDVSALSTSDWVSNPELVEPDVILLTDAVGVESSVQSRLLNYVKNGGRLLYTVGDNSSFLKELGFFVPKSPQIEDTIQPATVSWVDLKHPIFRRFQSSQYNDFSSIRFSRYTQIDIRKSSPLLNSIARLDTGEPLMVEGRVGNGEFVVWLFKNDLTWTNLPKNPRFVAVLFETLEFLYKDNEVPINFTVGEIPPWDTEALAESGYISPNSIGEDNVEFRCAVNVSVLEGDTTPITEEVFLLTYTKAGVKHTEVSQGQSISHVVDPDGFLIETEYGIGLLFSVLLLLVVEFFYMSSLSKEAHHV